MLLASCVTPSARSWTLEAAREGVPGAIVLELADVDARAVREELAETMGVTGAHVTSVDLVGELPSVREAAALVAVWEAYGSQPSVVHCARSAGALFADVQSLRLMFHVAGPSPRARALAERLAAVEQAMVDGDIEWLLGCPPQGDAVDDAAGQIAVAAAAGIRVRGVVVAPMPRKRDGWPGAMRDAAKSAVEDLALAVHPVAVGRARGGRAPVFDAPGPAVDEALVTESGSGERFLTFTLPGASRAPVSVGTWTADPAYPVTHVLVRIGGTVVRRPVDATLRRCRGTEAVLAGDTVTIGFTPHEGQWPMPDDRGGG